MASSIFSSYSTGENRITASILAVLQSLSLHRIERLLGALMEQSEFELIKFQNQPSGGGEGTPDAVIVSSFRLFIETKVKRNSLRADQLRRHLERLKGAPEKECKLLVLTPDERRPSELTLIDHQGLVWTSFASLDQAIDELLGDKNEVVSEREAFLLRELQTMLVAERLIGSIQDVVVVPARDAWPEYKRICAYVCQPNRPFQPVRRMAFYTAGQIFPLVPEILETHDEVEFCRGKFPGRLGEVIDELLKSSPRQPGNRYKVLLLSPPEDPRTIKLSAPIVNDLASKSGRTAAFTQNQRYVSEGRLRQAKTTRDLIETQ